MLSLLGMNVIPEYRLAVLPSHRYDFYFVRNRTNWLIEYNGLQHFEDTPHFHKQTDDFRKQQKIDKIKTYLACTNGFKLISIDYTGINENSVLYHIEQAINLDQPIYYSNNELYKWISQGTIDINMLNYYILTILT